MEQTRFEAHNIPPPRVLEQILRVPPSRASGLDHHPGRVTLHDGTVIERVLFVCEPHGLPTRGLNFEDIDRVAESPLRMPAAMADELYRAGESGVGYCVFQMVLRRRWKRSVIACATPGLVDFPPLPDGFDSRHIRAVRPHAGRGERQWPEPPFVICHFWPDSRSL